MNHQITSAKIYSTAHFYVQKFNICPTYAFPV